MASSMKSQDVAFEASSVDTRPLRDVRVDALLSMRELARLAGVAPSTIYLIEAGRTMPHPTVMRRLSAVLAVDPKAVTEFDRAIRVRARSARH
jgi:transcriptional regulator with XRE-family HTH domain